MRVQNIKHIGGFLFLVSLAITHSHSQTLTGFILDKNTILKVNTPESIDFNRPLVTFEINQTPYTANQAPLTVESHFEKSTWGITGHIKFTNSSTDTLTLSNVVPFGKGQSDVVITGLGQHRLSRTHLFLPGKKPVNVIVPDNAWELGFSATPLTGSTRIFALTRRDGSSLHKATRRRFETILAPGGSVNYHFYAELYEGEWQQALKICFQDRYLYDVKKFDASLFERSDLAWIRKAYVMHLLMAWDKDFYSEGRFTLPDFIDRGKLSYGGDDVMCIWPTWPTLGIDHRNQFDLYRDLPGGLDALRKVADESRKHGARFFIAYNPWDESTRSEGHLKGLAELIKGTSADGVVLDTKGESSRELQEAADQVKPGVIMYSEGMAVPKDMPGIISGRVHNALYYPPLFNLNKFIKPDFAIFRVVEVFKEPIQREYAVAFFNGYGTEINQFAPGHPDWEEEQYRYLGRTTRILRDNNSAFTQSYLPLISTLRDSVWVNQWQDASRDKTIYTLLSFNPAGLSGPLFEVTHTPEYHFIDLWKHEELKTVKLAGKTYAVVNIDGFDPRFLGTNNEGEVSCVARFKKRLNLTLESDRIIGTAQGELKIWKGDPTYDKQPLTLTANGTLDLSLTQTLDRYEGKLVLQLFEKEELLDEQILFLKPGLPRLISKEEPTTPISKIPMGMVRIPAGPFKIQYTQGDEFIPYPKYGLNETIQMSSFAMDQYPVTNAEFKKFMEATHYQPADSSHFLRHWVAGQIRTGEEKFPVTYVALEDAKAYAKWAGKRLPTEQEWQYAAQTSAGNEWPWKQSKPVIREETYVTETLTVKNIKGIDPRHANLGDGKLYPVGKYKKGVNPHGLFDLSGCVWQLTADEYQSGSYRYVIMKGGSYFKPSSSWWYVQGGPRESHYRQILLRVSPGFERNATVGFRCVADLIPAE